jgi:hypothetical protein
LDRELSTKIKYKLSITGSKVLRCSFGIVTWHQEKLLQLDRKTRKMVTIHGEHHLDVDYCVFPENKEEGR